MWGFAIYIGSSIPSKYLPEIVLLSPDKLLHVGVFFVFGLFVYRSLAGSERIASFRNHAMRYTFLLAGGYGIFDEVHQHFVPGRTADPFDVLADLLGISLALGLIGIIRLVKSRSFRVHMKS